MKNRIIILIAIEILAIIQNIYFFQSLPPIVASHFDASGLPNGFMSRTLFTLLNLGTVSLICGLFITLILLIPRIPASMINIPNKKYWLAKERQKLTIDFITRQLWIVGIVTLAFLIGLNQLVFSANTMQPVRLTTMKFFFLLVPYLSFLASVIYVIIKNFGKIPFVKERS